MLAATVACAAPAARFPDSLQPYAALRIATLAERILKLQAQVGQGMAVERARRALRSAVREIDADASALRARHGAGELHENFALLAVLAHEYGAWALRPATRENAVQLGARAEEVAWVARQGARREAAGVPGAADAPVLVAARAAELAQRIPRLYLWQRWGLGSGATASAIALARVQLRSSLDALQRVASGVSGLDSELQLALNQASFLELAAREVSAGRERSRNLEVMARAGDNILESLERVERLLVRP
jgi:hypothetical protein